MSIALNAARDNGLTTGWHVFPLKPNGKHPLPGSRGFKDAAADPEQIRRLFSGCGLANLGISTGPSGLYVIDVDVKEGQGGQESWDALVAIHGHVETYTVRTWSGGLHYYYSRPDGPLNNTSGETNGLGKGIDTRGIGGYVVAPPSSVSENGKQGSYEVILDVPVAPLPQWIVDALAKPEPKPFVSTGDLAAAEHVEARVQALANELAESTSGANHLAASLSVKVGNYVGAGQISRDQAERIMLGALADWSWAAPQDEQTMHNTIRRQIDFGAQRSDRPWEAPVKKSNGLYDPWANETIPVSVPKPKTHLVAVPEIVAEAEVEKEAERALTDWATNLGQAHHLQANLGVRLIHTEGVGWFRWDGKRWAQTSDGEVMGLIGEFYRRQFRAMLTKYATTEEEKYNEIAKQYKKFMSTATLNSIVAVMKTIPQVMVKVESLDSDRHLINTPSGIVDLRTGEVSGHDPKRLMTKMTRGSYRPEIAMHPDWINALSGSSKQSAEYMQLRFGQAATGYTPEDAVFMVGGGQNSKSCILDGVTYTLNDYAVLSGEALISSGGRDSKAASPDKAGLRGARMAYIEEMPEGAHLSVAELKRVVETSKITARFLNANPFTFDATHSLFVTSNDEPRVAETDHGTWRRLSLVKFRILFCSNPSGPNERKADPMLKLRLQEGQQGQHDAVMTWMVQGAMRYFADRGLMASDRRPDEIASNVHAWRGKADRIQGFYEDIVVADPGGVIATVDAYAAFSAFVTGQGHQDWSMETFSNRFMTHQKTVAAGVEKKRGPRDPSGLQRPRLPLGSGKGNLQPLKPQVQVYRGVRFRTEADDLL